MAKQIFKTILLGILIGVLFFIMPFFILRFLLIFLLIGAIFRLWWGGTNRRWKHQYGWHHAYADKIRNMTDEEYAAFKNKTDRWSCGYHYHCGSNNYNHGCWEARDEKKQTKNQTTNDQTQSL